MGWILLVASKNLSFEVKREERGERKLNFPHSSFLSPLS
jgi:hypothetical protein